MSDPNPSPSTANPTSPNTATGESNARSNSEAKLASSEVNTKEREIATTRQVDPFNTFVNFAPAHTAKEYLTFSFEARDSLDRPIRAKSGADFIGMVFTVNPSNFDRSYKKTIDRQQTRAGWVEYHGGDELDTINVSGVVSAFVDVGGALTSTQNLIQNSHGWQEYMQLVSLFRSNGNYYDRGKGMIYEAGNIVLTYDEGVYKGVFESLNITESSEKPFSIDYSFSFIVEETIYKFRYPIVNNHRKLL